MSEKLGTGSLWIHRRKADSSKEVGFTEQAGTLGSWTELLLLGSQDTQIIQ